MVVDIFFMLSIKDGRIPVEPVFHVLGLHGLVLHRMNHHTNTFAGIGIQEFNGTLVTSSHHIPRIVGIKAKKSRFTTRRIIPLAFCNAAATRVSTGNPNRGIVLLPCINIVRKQIINIDPVKLCSGLVVLG